MNIEIQRVKVGEFISYIKKLLSIDKFIHLKIKDGQDGPIIISNCYLPERDAVKLQQVPIADILETDLKLKKSILKISFFNGNYAIDALKHFLTSNNVSGTIVASEVNGELVATNLIINSDDLTVDIKCCDPSLGFQDLTAEQVKAIFSTDNKLFSFDIDSFHVEKLNSLFNLEKEKETFKIAIDKTGVRFKSEGDVYNNLVTQEVTSKKEEEVLFYKKYLALFDKETYNITICSNKAVLKSKDSNTLITIATCQGA